MPVSEEPGIDATICHLVATPKHPGWPQGSTDVFPESDFLPSAIIPIASLILNLSPALQIKNQPLKTQAQIQSFQAPTYSQSWLEWPKRGVSRPQPGLQSPGDIWPFS